jgi:hypothetical protein
MLLRLKLNPEGSALLTTETLLAPLTAIVVPRGFPTVPEILAEVLNTGTAEAP